MRRNKRIREISAMRKRKIKKVKKNVKRKQGMVKKKTMDWMENAEGRSS